MSQHLSSGDPIINEQVASERQQVRLEVLLTLRFDILRVLADWMAHFIGFIIRKDGLLRKRSQIHKYKSFSH